MTNLQRKTCSGHSRTRARCLSALLAGLALMFVSLEQVEAVPIVIQNPSFEDFVLANPGNFTVDGTGLNGFGWTTSSMVPSVGVFRGGPFFLDPIPDGVNTAFAHGPVISQVLSDVLTANTQYTLRVEIGNATNVAFPGYQVQLLAAGVLLAEDNSTLSPSNGRFLTSVLSFTALPGDPNLGEQIEIAFRSMGTETNFDFVRLDATPTSVVPEPSSLALVGVGFIGLIRLARNRRKTHGNLEQ